MPAWKLREIELDYERDEAAGAAVYGAEWLTLEKLMATPSAPSMPWTAPAGPEHDEPEEFPYLAGAIARHSDD